MIKWPIIVVLLAAAVYLFLRQINKPKYYRRIARDAFPEFIEGMMSQGGDGFLLFLDHEGSDRYLQFAKYIESPSRRNLHFGFPLAPWSTSYYANLKAKLTAAGFRCTEKETAEGVVKRFLCVDYLESADEAARLASLAFDVLGVGEGDTFTAHYAGPLNMDEWNRHVQAQRERNIRNDVRHA